MIEQTLFFIKFVFSHRMSSWMIHGTFQGDQSPCLQDFIRIRPLVRLTFSSGISLLRKSMRKINLLNTF